jgi:hypothetical protein
MEGATHAAKVPRQGHPGWRLPRLLLRHLEPNTRLAAKLHDTGRGSYLLSGIAVTDAEALSQIDIPGHETCVEVGKLREGDADGSAAG